MLPLVVSFAPVQRRRVHNTASPENLRDWPVDSLVKHSDLKCRCYQFQVLSRGLTLAGSDGRTISTKLHRSILWSA